jgi:hypothetical protein
MYTLDEGCKTTTTSSQQQRQNGPNRQTPDNRKRFSSSVHHKMPNAPTTREKRTIDTKPHKSVAAAFGSCAAFSLFSYWQAFARSFLPFYPYMRICGIIPTHHFPLLLSIKHIPWVFVASVQSEESK